MSIFEYDEEKEMELIRQAENEVGRAEGRAEEKIEIILNMHKKNYPPKEISEIIDMSEEEVKAIIYSQEPALV